MSLIIKTNAIKVKKDDGTTKMVDILTDKALDDALQDIENKGNEVLDSIPEDYTKLSEDVDEIKEHAVTNVHLYSDGAGIVFYEEKDTFTDYLTFNQIKAIIEDDTNSVFLTNGYYSMYSKYIYRPEITGDTDVDAIGFIGITKLHGKPYLWRVLINSNNELTEEETELATSGDISELRQGGLADHSLTIDKMAVGTLGYVTPEMFGAKGDGVTDDTSAIQQAIDSGKPVVFTDKTYRVIALHETTNINTIVLEYALKLKNNTTLIGNNTKIICDKTAIYTINKSNIIVKGFDFTKQNEREMEPIFNIDDSTELHITDCTFHDYYGDGLVLYKCRESVIERCKFWDFTGNGLSAGKLTTHMYKTTFNDITVTNQHEYGTNTSANPFIISGHDCIINGLNCYNCAWGIKIQSASYNIRVSNILFVGGDLATANTGFKLQGADGSFNHDIVVDNIVVKDATIGFPLYIYKSTNCSLNNVTVINGGNTIRIRDSYHTQISNLKLIESLGLEVKENTTLTVNGLNVQNVEKKINLVFVSEDLAENNQVIINGGLFELTEDSTIFRSSSTTANVLYSNINTNNIRLFTESPIITLLNVFKIGEKRRFEVELSNYDYTDITDTVFIRLSMSTSEALFLKTLPDVKLLMTTGYTVEGIKAIRVIDGAMRIYHGRSEETRIAHVEIMGYMISST